MKCNTCKDSGFVVCELCEGNGTSFKLMLPPDALDDNCSRCIGTGKQPCLCPTRTELETCELCNGTGLDKECPQCQGGGELQHGGKRDEMTQCGTCYGSGHERHCDLCEGKGKLIYED